ncbi:MAG: TolC family protein, partial [Nitrospirae bacterium]
YKTTPIPNFDVLLKRISKNPDIARWFKEIQQKEAALELEKARKFPNLTLTGGIRHKSAVDDNVFIMELSIPIPIFNRNQGDILRAKYRLNNAIEMKKVVSLRVTTSLSDAYKDLSKAYEAIKIMDREVLKNAQSTFDAVREGYRQGKFDLLNVLDAQRTLFSVKEQYIMILTSYHTSIAEIERLIGGSGLVNLGK